MTVVVVIAVSDESLEYVLHARSIYPAQHAILIYNSITSMHGMHLTMQDVFQRQII